MNYDSEKSIISGWLRTWLKVWTAMPDHATSTSAGKMNTFSPTWNIWKACFQSISAPEKIGAPLRLALRAKIRSGAPTSAPASNPERCAPTSAPTAVRQKSQINKSDCKWSLQLCLWQLLILGRILEAMWGQFYARSAKFLQNFSVFLLIFCWFYAS